MISPRQTIARSRLRLSVAHQSSSIRRNEFERIANIRDAGYSTTNMHDDLVEDKKYIGHHEMNVALFTHSMLSQKVC